MYNTRIDNLDTYACRIPMLSNRLCNQVTMAKDSWKNQRWMESEAVYDACMGLTHSHLRDNIVPHSADHLPASVRKAHMAYYCIDGYMSQAHNVYYVSWSINLSRRIKA